MCNVYICTCIQPDGQLLAKPRPWLYNVGSVNVLEDTNCKDSGSTFWRKAVVDKHFALCRDVDD